jgi:riboflavin biosynthesis pyrimidine reductase
VSDSPQVGAVGDITELASFYAEPAAGVRANMIFSADGAAAFGARAGPCPTDQQLLKLMRGFADVVLVGAATARRELRTGAAHRHSTGQAAVRRTGQRPRRSR